MIKAMMIKKIISLEIIFSLIMGIIAARLGYVQIIRNNVFLEGASDLWQRSFPLTPSRGYILDRNGKELAINIPSMSIAFIPFQVKEKAKTASALSPILNMNAKDIYDQINKRISIVRLSKQGRKINQEQAIAIATLNLEGVYIVQDSSRYYPYETMLSHTLGFVGIDNQGLAGIEAPAWKLISSVDLKGCKKGGAMVSEKHANFIINTGNAKSKDVLYLIELIRKKVYDYSGIKLIREIIVIDRR